MRRILMGLLLAASSMAWAAPGPATTQVQYLSGTDKDHRVNWEFMVNGGRKAGIWTTIPVPSNWEMEGFGTYRYFSDTNEPAPDSTGIYRHRFEVPASWKDRQVEIVFGAVMTDTRVTVNGHSAGPMHQGGFYEFRYDITKWLKPGQSNTLEVTVNRYSANASVNRAERAGDYWLFSGIYRPVWLEAKPLSNIERLTVDARHTGEFRAQVFAGGRVPDGARVSVQIATLDGKPVGRPITGKVVDGMAQLSGQLGKVQPWSAELPQRYQARFRLFDGQRLVHEVSKTFGFRTIELRKHDGLYVNGAKVRLKGSNRHSIWPTSGRVTSKALSYADAKLMKEMNMNAVRMSHYPPDQHFLDVCDEVGLYVIDELAGWQKAYDTDVATPLVKELVQRDQHHPSVIMWANGNEGGYNFALDPLYAKWDLQQRPVIHPWANFGGIDTAHYLNYDCCASSFFHGRDVFMPTEFLHGLYDGGAGAGLDDWWKAMLAHPLSAGGFIWAFADEGIVRADKNGAIDVAGNLAPDGIVGPYREKEGSFFAIKEIWSPLYVPLAELPFLPASFDGKLALENRYDFTNLNAVKLQWKLVDFGTEPGFKVGAQGSARAPDVAPGLRGSVQLQLPADWRRHDAFMLSAFDPFGREIYTWSWMIASPKDVAARMAMAANGAATLSETASGWEMKAGQVSLVIDKASGYLRTLSKGGTVVPLSNGPRPLTGDAVLKSIKATQEGADAVVRAEYSAGLNMVEWRLRGNGQLSLTYAYGFASGKQADALGVTFDYPEQQVTGMRWLGKGPYRVWKNRTKGVEFGVWQKDYNDAVTGLSWQYPEFKGFHDQVYWATLSTRNLPLTFVNHGDGIALRVFTPAQAPGGEFDPKTTKVNFPPGDISFMNAILPIGTKFKTASEHGPQGQSSRSPNLGQWYSNTVDILIGDR